MFDAVHIVYEKHVGPDSIGKFSRNSKGEE
jgi:hypothetical protein